MDLPSLLSAFRSLLENWPFWIVFTASFLSVIQPRWFWDEKEYASRDGRADGPSSLWLHCTRVSGLIFMAMVLAVLCSRQAEP